MKYSITPFFKDLPQEINNKSWVAIDNSSENGIKITFFNNDQAPESHKFDSFKDFAQAYMDDNFLRCDSKQFNITEEKACATGISSYSEEDLDENSGKSFMVHCASAQVLDIYKGLDIKKIDSLAQQSNSDLYYMEKSGSAAAQDSHEYRRDPYAYYGLSRKDFM